MLFFYINGKDDVDFLLEVSQKASEIVWDDSHLKGFPEKFRQFVFKMTSELHSKIDVKDKDSVRIPISYTYALSLAFDEFGEDWDLFFDDNLDGNGKSDILDIHKKFLKELVIEISHSLPMQKADSFFSKLNGERKLDLEDKKDAFIYHAASLLMLQYELEKDTSVAEDKEEEIITLDNIVDYLIFQKMAYDTDFLAFE